MSSSLPVPVSAPAKSGLDSYTLLQRVNTISADKLPVGVVEALFSLKARIVP